MTVIEKEIGRLGELIGRKEQQFQELL